MLRTVAMVASVGLALAAGTLPSSVSQTEAVIPDAGTLGPFYFTFKTYQASDVAILVDDDYYLTASQYSVSLNADQDTSPGGSVTLLVTLTAGHNISIRRLVPLTHTTSYTPYSPFPAKVLERDIDRVTMQVQQLQRDLSRVSRGNDGGYATDPNAVHVTGSQSMQGPLACTGSITSSSNIAGVNVLATGTVQAGTSVFAGQNAYLVGNEVRSYSPVYSDGGHPLSLTGNVGAATGLPSVIVSNAARQSSGDLLEVKGTPDGGVLASFDYAGQLTTPTVFAQSVQASSLIMADQIKDYTNGFEKLSFTDSTTTITGGEPTDVDGGVSNIINTPTAQSHADLLQVQNSGVVKFTVGQSGMASSVAGVTAPEVCFDTTCATRIDTDGTTLNVIAPSGMTFGTGGSIFSGIFRGTVGATGTNSAGACSTTGTGTITGAAAGSPCFTTPSAIQTTGGILAVSCSVETTNNVFLNGCCASASNCTVPSMPDGGVYPVKVIVFNP